MFFFDNLGACICSQIVKLKAVMCQYVYVSPAPLTAFITQTSLMLLTKSRFFSINLLTFFIYFFFFWQSVLGTTVLDTLSKILYFFKAC